MGGRVTFVIVVLLLCALISWRVDAEYGFVNRRGTQLMLNGSPFYANGFNAYWLMYAATEPSEREKVTSVFREAQQHGLKFARTWAFNDGQYRPLQVSPGIYNEQAFQGLDFVITEARNFGIKLVLSLGNNYPSFGGRTQYVKWAQNQGQSVYSDDHFYTNWLIKEFYKNNIRRMLTRRNSITGVLYKDDPTIMAWELINEPRCPSDPSGRTIQTWITEMASHVKSIDGNHLLEVGLEGFYGAFPYRQAYNPNFQVGTDFIRNNQIPGIDFATVHSYPDEWLTTASDYERELFLKKWVAIHIQDAQNVLRKPLLFAEFGKSVRISSTSQRDEVYRTVYSSIMSSAGRGGVAIGSAFWQLFTEGMDSFRDGYEVVLSQNPTTANVIAYHSFQLNQLRRRYVRQKNMARWRQGEFNGTQS